MLFQEGQGILGRIAFVDGNVPEYDRTYLVVKVDTNYIEVINVSSTKGKERKLAFPKNERLRIFNPPFLKPSFVKLDSLTCVPSSEWSTLKVLNGGRTLDTTELKRIQNLL